MLPHVGLPFGIQRRVRAIAIEQLKLNRLISWPIQQSLGDVPVVGADHLLVANPVRVLPLRRAQGDEEAERVLIRHVRLLVSGLDVLPECVVEAFVNGSLDLSSIP